MLRNSASGVLASKASST